MLRFWRAAVAFAGRSAEFGFLRGRGDCFLRAAAPVFAGRGAGFRGARRLFFAGRGAGFRGAQRRLGVFSDFSKSCTPGGQENFGFPALFLALWAFFNQFLIFVPLFYQKQGYKTDKFFKKRPRAYFTPRNSLRIRHMKGTKILKLLKNAQ